MEWQLWREYPHQHIKIFQQTWTWQECLFYSYILVGRIQITRMQYIDYGSWKNVRQDIIRHIIWCCCQNSPSLSGWRLFKRLWGMQQANYPPCHPYSWGEKTWPVGDRGLQQVTSLSCLNWETGVKLISTLDRVFLRQLPATGKIFPQRCNQDHVADPSGI